MLMMLMMEWEMYTNYISTKLWFLIYKDSCYLLEIWTLMVINQAIIHICLKHFYASSEQNIISFLEGLSPKLKEADLYPAESNIYE